MQLFLLLACVLVNLYLAGGLYLRGGRNLEMSVAYHTGWSTGASIIALEICSLFFGAMAPKKEKIEYQKKVRGRGASSEAKDEPNTRSNAINNPL